MRFYFLYLFLLVGCGTLKTIPIDKVEKTATGVILPIDVEWEGTDESWSCRLEFFSDRSVFAKVYVKQQLVFLPLLPGNYYWKSIGCSAVGAEYPAGAIRDFTVYAGKQSLVQPVYFRVEGPRQISFGFYAGSEELKALEALDLNMVSGYTGEPVEK